MRGDGDIRYNRSLYQGRPFVAIDPAVLSDDFPARASSFLRGLCEQQPAPGFDAIRIPGARSIDRDRTATTVTVDEVV